MSRDGSSEFLRIGIVGSNGYLGATLMRNLQKKNVHVYPIGREFLKDETFPELDFIIDSGFPRNIHNKNVKMEYFKNLTSRLEHCSSQNTTYLYFGSLSSHSPATSKYGTAKREAENLVVSMRGRVIRFGLVVDRQEPGGRYLELVKNLRSFPVILVPHPDYFPICVTYIKEFSGTLDRVIFERENSVSDATAPIEWTCLSQLVRNSTDRRVIVLPKFITKITCEIIRILPLGKLDNLKAIAYKITDPQEN